MTLLSKPSRARLLAGEVAQECEEASQWLARLAHPTRLKILCAILDSEGKAGVTELSRACGLAQPILSQFLARMTREGLLVGQREGRLVRYQILDERVMRLLSLLHDIFCSSSQREKLVSPSGRAVQKRPRRSR